MGLRSSWRSPASASAQTASATQDVYTNNVRYNTGQSIQPVFEGWSRNPDGSFDMWFGYLNRNFEERITVAAGPTTASTAKTWASPNSSRRGGRCSRSR